MDKITLYKLGLTKQEVDIYLSLLENETHTIKEISQITGINRTTTYRYIQSLENKGLVKWIVGTRGKIVQIFPVDNLETLLNSLKRNIKEIEIGLPELLKNLKQIQPLKRYQSQVRYYECVEGLQQMIWNNLSINPKETSRSYTVFRRREFINPKFEDEFEKEWVRRRLKDHVITNEDRFEYINKRLVGAYRTESLDIHIIPKKKYYITNDILIYNDVFAIISLEKGNLLGVEIENEEIAKTQRSIFDLVWSIGSSYKKNE